MSLPKFDNLNDVISKFVSTVCYYKDVPVLVKTAMQSDADPTQFMLSITSLNGPGMIIDVHDPLFRYVNYNIGYVNTNIGASWWYRRPAKQYQQGLRGEQLRFYSENGLDKPNHQFAFQKPYVDMLSNKYMAIADCEKAVSDGKMLSAAWHKDFALAWSEFEQKYLMYYRANRVGTFSKKGQGELYPHASYVKEALEEALSQCNNSRS